MPQIEDLIYQEKLRSPRTLLLFLGLACLGMGLGIWRLVAAGWGWGAAGLLLIGLVFTFYRLNYRQLVIRITQDQLILKFGLVKWTSRLDNISAVFLDDSPPLIRYGGAGVHFAFVRGSYRAFFNFLDHPRLVLELQKKQGPVRELVFSTAAPDRVADIIRSYQESDGISDHSHPVLS